MLNEAPSTITDAGWNFNNTYTRLPQSFYTRLDPVPVREPRMVFFNPTLAESLGLQQEALKGELGISVFGGNRIPKGAEPIAQAYAGHQFGYFTMLGDGRAILLGEQLTPEGQRYDLQLKGSGQTPFSRRGDGRAALAPMLREAIISEAMAALGVPTTRSLAVVATGEQVVRETMLPGAILTRVAASHIRVGTFEYVATWGKPEDLKALVDYTIERHYPELVNMDKPYPAFLKAVMERQAALIAQWQSIGFIHGVMNTDNMAISGETIDYGPCAFMDTYDPATVFSSIDVKGRYAYGNQPVMAQWNLARFTETILPLLHSDSKKALELGKEAVDDFSELFQNQWLIAMKAKLGLFTEEADDRTFIEDLLNWMHRNQADFTHTFRTLSGEGLPEGVLYQETGFQDWYARWQARLKRQPQSRDEVFDWMRRHNPFVIPRNYKVEKALEAAVQQGDFSVMYKLIDALKAPYLESLETKSYALLPESTGIPYKTFCGT